MEQDRAITTNAPFGGVSLRKVEREAPADGQALLSTVETGICGTDRGIVSGALGFSYNPAGRDYMVLGHECIARVASADGEGLRKGDYVVPATRSGGGCLNCLVGRPDNCSDNDRHDAGVTGKDGFMRDSFVYSTSDLVKVNDESVADVAVLTEPMKNVMKVFDSLSHITKLSVYHGKDGTLRSRRALVVGTGCEGFLFSMMASDAGYITQIVNRHDISERQKRILDTFDVDFADYSRPGALQGEGVDLLVDTSGDPAALLGMLRHVRPNGVAVCFGTNENVAPASMSGGDIINIVEKNIVVLGSVDGSKKHYMDAVRQLSAWRKCRPDAMKQMITGRFRPENTGILLARQPGEIKSVISWQ